MTTYHLFGIGFAAIALGLARAIARCLHRARRATRCRWPRPSSLRDNAVIQSQVALAEAKLRSSRTYLLQAVADAWDDGARGEALALPQRAMLRLAATYAVHQAKDVVDTAYHAAGATAIFESNPFERRFRDMHAVSQQVQAQFANFEMVGQVLLGLPSQSKLI